MKQLLILVACGLVFSGCTSPHKKFKAPSDAKVKAATADLNIKVKRARETAAKSKKAAEEAQEISNRIVLRAGTLKELLDKLTLSQTSEEYKGPLRVLSDNVDALIAENVEMQTKMKELLGWNIQLQDQLAAAEKARVALQVAEDEYAVMAIGLAQECTDEREKLIAVQKQLIGQKIFGWMWKLALAFVVAIFILVIILKIGAKIGWWGASKYLGGL